jgi:hypothetical protein
VSSPHIRTQAERLRAVPLEEVLELLGAERDRQDKAKWHTAQGALSISGTKFMNWKAGRGGGGAIDLAMHLGAMDFKAALQWLAKYFPASLPPETSPALTKPILQLPLRDDRRLPVVRSYLLQERHLSAALIEPLIASGTLYADPRGNAVFLLLGEEGSPVGAEIRGTTRTPWRGMAPGSRKDLGYFSILAPEPVATILCESAIDAVSCLALHPHTHCVSTAGARPNPRWLPLLIRGGQPLYCGFDADPTGDAMACAMIAAYPAVSRLRPQLKDWNDVLTRSPR